MWSTLPATLLFLLMMAGLFVPLEAFFPARDTKPSRRAMGKGAALLVANTLLMQWLGVPVLQALGPRGGRQKHDAPNIAGVALTTLRQPAFPSTPLGSRSRLTYSR